MGLGFVHWMDSRDYNRDSNSCNVMEELLTGLGGGSVGLGALVWYAKARFIKFDKKINGMSQELRKATEDNNLQKDQIERLREENKDIRQELRDIRKKA